MPKPVVVKKPKDKLAHVSDLWEIEERLRNNLVVIWKSMLTKEDLLALEKRLSKLIKRPRFDWTVGLVQNKVQAKEKNMIIKITNEQQVSVALHPKTDAGRAVTVDGVPVWEVIDGEATVTPAEDGLSALLVSGDNPGTTQILVKADADLGEGVEEISEIIELQVAGATAKNLGLSVGTPELKPVVE